MASSIASPIRETFVRFIDALRNAEVRVSPAESIDAFEAMAVLGVQNGRILRDGWASILAKSAEEKTLFNQVFDRFFGLDEPRSSSASQASGGSPDDGEGLELASNLGQQLLAENRASLLEQIEQAGRTVQVEQMQFFTQKGLYTQRMLEIMGQSDLKAEMEALAAPEQALLEGRLSELRGQVRDYVERQFLLHADSTGSRLRAELFMKVKLAHVDQRTIEQMQPLVKKIARKLVVQYRRKPKGLRRALNVPATLRANMGTDAIPFNLRWRYRRPERAKIFVICDLSGSMRSTAKFMLLLLYSLQEVLPQVRSFGFSDRLTETTEWFENYPLEKAIEETIAQCAGGSTDYAQAWQDFERICGREVDRRSHLIVLGDARNNYSDPKPELLASLYHRCRRLIWLNPEARYSWFSGDAVMKQYLSYCHQADVCRSLLHLERFASRLLRYLC